MPERNGLLKATSVHFICKNLSIIAVFALISLTYYNVYAEIIAKGEEAEPWVEVRLPWALGVVFSDGTLLENGVRLDWSKVSNITLVAKLPNISWTDNTIYLILSAMNIYGEVIQVAAGLNPNEQMWQIYAFYISDITHYPQTYIWIANRSLPQIMPGERVALALHLIEDEGWRFTAQNLNTGDASNGLFPAGKVRLKNGEHEVFALESYTTNPIVFREMDEAVLEGIYVDGFKIVGEGYLLGGWDPLHKPLFLVGGGNVPGFISVVKSSNQYKWVYSQAESWESSVAPLYVGLAYASAIILVIVLAVVFKKEK
ncbi:MAG: hypothetical protein QXE57_04720 [Nitrososphaerales archaeon]